MVKTTYLNIFMMLGALGLLIGLIPAVLSGLPTRMSSFYASLWIWLPIILVLVILSGAVFSLVAIRLAFKRDFVQTLRNK
jgi:hypothetical protein